MPIDYGKHDGQLVWVRNPFTGTITYFTDIHRKQSGFARPPVEALWGDRADVRFASELEAAQQRCAFCPGNEHMTVDEVLRVPRPASDAGTSRWLIRAFHNIIPRVPQSCTGGRNESYVVVEDPRHFVDGAKHPHELLYSALLTAEQLRQVLAVEVEVARRAYANTAVTAVLVRKNQGRESGASQPHVHSQVIGCDQPFPPVAREAERLLEEPGLWKDILSFAEGEGFMITRRGPCALYFCPFGTFPRSYEVVCEDVRVRITDAAAEVLDAFADLLHRALAILGPLPLDYEIHDGPGVPLHAHICARHFAYSNIGGTLNLPANIVANIAHPPSRPIG